MANSRPSAVFFASDEPARLAAFYAEVLELSEPASAGDSLGMSAGDVHLGFEKTPSNTPGRVTVWFDVDDMDETLARLVEHGGRISSGPDATCSPGELLATGLDAEGNPIGFIARTSK